MLWTTVIMVFSNQQIYQLGICHNQAEFEYIQQQTLEHYWLKSLI